MKKILNSTLVAAALAISTTATAQLPVGGNSPYAINITPPTVEASDSANVTGYGENLIELPELDPSDPLPFGANLFMGGYEAERFDGLSDDYLVAPGDQIAIWLWGATNLQQTVTVDNQGNIFIPSVGPLSTRGISASQLNTHIEEQVKQIYTNNVSVYVNLLSATPVSVFIAGNVNRPGQYAGLPTDSLLYYLKRAGGIDFDRGSFRSIDIVRNGEVVSNIDLYQFLLSGQLERVQLRDGDTIVVNQIGPVVTVTSGARNALRLEFLSGQTAGSELMNIARPISSVSHVGVVGTRDGQPFSDYFELNDFQSSTLVDGDSVIFNSDLQPNIYNIQVQGAYLGPSIYTVDKGMTLHQVLAQIEVDPTVADIANIRLTRVSVAQQQKEQIEQSLRRLERSVFTAPVSSTGDAAIRSYEAQMVMQFIERAREFEPIGNVIVSDAGSIADIQLEQGDQVIIPVKSELIQIAGEVLVPQAVVFNANATLKDYVSWAGGFTDRSDFERIGILRANGKLDFIEAEQFDLPASEFALAGGAQILVFPRVDTKTLQSVKDITQIIYQIAVAANAVSN